MTVTVAAFYEFVAVSDGAAMRARLLDICRADGIVGTILIAAEGINGTIAGQQDAIDAVLAAIARELRLDALDAKRSTCQSQPFARLKVRLKREIVTFGVPEANPALRRGTYVEAQDWNGLISEPGVVVIDTRNSYEVKIGTFPGAVDPATRAFGEFPAFVQANLDPARNKKVAMFCTGGIRCEKASAYLVGLGFEEVYHLKGGILKYLETVPEAESLWHGECYVFDERVAVSHGVQPGRHVLCPDCGGPVAEGETCTHVETRQALMARRQSQ